MSPANLSENPPAHVSLLLAFANTIDVDDGTERLDSPESLATWLTETGLSPSGVRATLTDLESARSLRTALRDHLRSNHGPGAAPAPAPGPGTGSGHDPGPGTGPGSGKGGAAGGAGRDPGDGSALAAAAVRFPLRMGVRDGTPVAVPAADGVPGALGSVVAAILAAQGDGSLPRLKICAEDTCQYAFADASKNRSRQWCSMSVCGNRAKTRTYRARRRDTP